MLSVSDYADLLDKLATQNFVIDPDKCISVRNKNIRCGKCHEACVSGCIQIDGRRLLVDTSRCISCGTCATACPTGALQTINPSDDELLKNMQNVLNRNGTTAVVACSMILKKAAAMVDPESVLRVTCLGRIDESLILAAAALGASRIVLVSDKCEECSYHQGTQTISAVCASAKTLLGAWNSSCVLKLTQKFPRLCARETAEHYDFQRRDFLLSMKASAASGGKEAAAFVAQKGFAQDVSEGQREQNEYTHVGEDGTLAHYKSKRRRVLASALTRLGEPADKPVACRLWQHIHIDTSRCNGCQMCAVFCPSAALAKHIEQEAASEQKAFKLYRAPGNPKLKSKNSTATTPKNVAKHHETPGGSNAVTGEKVSLVYTPGLCVNCGCCVQLCPQKAISATPEIPAKAIFDGSSESIPLKDIFPEKGGPDAIRNSMSKLIQSKYLW